MKRADGIFGLPKIYYIIHYIEKYYKYYSYDLYNIIHNKIMYTQKQNTRMDVYYLYTLVA